jgi:hypothetical protein
LSTLGFTIFELIKKETKSQNIFYCKGKEAFGEGEYQEDGFVVYKGSKANKKLTPTCNSTIKNLRAKLIEDIILVEQENLFVFNEDYSFSSPSAAASQVLARNANGWIEWKDKNGKTLDELKRK